MKADIERSAEASVIHILGKIRRGRHVRIRSEKSRNRGPLTDRASNPVIGVLVLSRLARNSRSSRLDEIPHPVTESNGIGNDDFSGRRRRIGDDYRTLARARLTVFEMVR